MKNISIFRKTLAIATLLATTVTGMEALQAAPLTADVAVIAPVQANVVSKNIALKKKRRTKKKSSDAMKKTDDAMKKTDDAMKKPEGDAMKKPEGDAMQKPNESGDAMKK